MTRKQGQRRPDADATIIECLASGSTKAETARVAGVGVRTVARRQADPAFIAEVRKFRSAMLDGAAGQLSSVARKAVSKLESLLDSESDAVALGSARAILDSLLKVSEMTQVQSRIASLEDALKVGSVNNQASGSSRLKGC